jgi:hypothetical protein
VEEVAGRLKMYIVSVGNFVTGMDFYGPFNTHKEATDWVFENNDYELWMVIRLKDRLDFPTPMIELEIREER